MDVAITTNSDCFFPFADLLSSVMKCFSRDPYVRENALVGTHRPIPFLMPGDVLPTLVPASGVHPFKGLAKYAAPLSLVYSSEADAYFALRHMYTRLWCRLNTVDAEEGNLAHLCKTYEDVLFSQHPTLFLHLIALGVPPLSIAFPWIHLAFVGYLPVTEVLSLWDRLLARSSLLLLPLTAAAIVLFRSEVLLACRTGEEAREVFGEGQLNRIKVVPLLQSLLFLEEFK